MQRAFPSVDHDYQEWVMDLLEVPVWFRTIVRRGFFRVSHVMIGCCTQGGKIERFHIRVGHMTCGITQGNPLSALWFLSVFNLLLWKLE